MEEIFLSIKDGKENDIKMIKFKKQCPYCKKEKTCNGRHIDLATGVFEINCSNCHRTFRIPIDDYNNVQGMTEP